MRRYDLYGRLMALLLTYRGEFIKALAETKNKIQKKYHLICCLSFIFLSFILITIISGWNIKIDIENSRYLFSTLAQSQAAIIAVVVSLTILAVQFVSQTYTPKVSDLFLRKKLFWFLILVYGSSIIYDLVILNSIDKNFTYLVLYNYNLVLYNYIGIVWAILSFSLLILFTKDVIDSLKPEQVIQDLINEIDMGTITAYSAEEKLTERDTIDDHLILLIRVMMQADDISAADGIDTLSDFFKKCINKEKGNHPKLVLTYFFGHVEILVNAVFEKKSDIVLRNAIAFIGTIGKEATKLNSQNEAIWTCKLLVEICGQSINKEICQKAINLSNIVGEFYDAPYDCLNPTMISKIELTEIGKLATDGMPVVARDVARFNKWEEAEKSYWDNGGRIIYEVIESLGKLGKIAVEKGQMGETEEIIDSIFDFGDIILERGIGIIENDDRSCFPETHPYTVDVESPDPLNPVIQRITSILTSENMDGGLAFNHMLGLGNIGKCLAKNGIAPFAVLTSLKRVSESHKENRIDTRRYCLMYATEAVLNGQDDTAEWLINRLREDLSSAHDEENQLEGCMDIIINEIENNRLFGISVEGKMSIEEINAFKKVISCYNDA